MVEIMEGWAPPARSRRVAALLVDAVLAVATLGVGWLLGVALLARRSSTPGLALMGVTVFASDTREPATPSRMLLRGLVYQPLSALLGLVTFGFGWVYSAAGALGERRLCLYDEWAQVVVLAPPR